jgi:hypothetical protein
MFDAVTVGAAEAVGSNVGDKVGISVGRSDAEGAGDAEGTDEGAGEEDGAAVGIPDGSCEGIREVEGMADGALVLNKNSKHAPSMSVQTFSSPAHWESRKHT